MSPAATEYVMETQGRAAEQLAQVSLGFMNTAAVYTAAKLNIAGLLASGARHVSELASETQSNEDALYRVLRALAAAGIFTETAPRTFALTPAAEALRPGIPGSIKSRMTRAGSCWSNRDSALSASWAHIALYPLFSK